MRKFLTNKSTRITFIASAVIATVYFVGDYVLVGSNENCDGPCRPRKSLCVRPLEEQVRNDVSILKVRVDKTGGNAVEQTDTGYCLYAVSVVQHLSGENKIPAVLSLTEQNPFNPPVSCKPVGSEFLVILEEGAGEAEVRNCHNSAIVDLSKQDEILNLLAQTREK